MTLRFNALAIIANIAVLSLSATAFAGQAPAAPSGSGLFLNYCASCHGPQAKGDGPVAAAMQKKPADLTGIAKRNGGKFPTEIVSRTHRWQEPCHGTRRAGHAGLERRLQARPWRDGARCRQDEDRRTRAIPRVHTAKVANPRLARRRWPLPEAPPLRAENA